MIKRFIIPITLLLVFLLPLASMAMQPGEGGGEFIAVCHQGVMICCQAGIPPSCESVPCEYCDIYWLDTDGNWYYVTTKWAECCNPDPVFEV